MCPIKTKFNHVSIAGKAILCINVTLNSEPQLLDVIPFRL